MQSLDRQKLKASLNEAINEWFEKEYEKIVASFNDVVLGESVTELMTDSAYNILLAQENCYTYLKNDGQLAE